MCIRDRADVVRCKNGAVVNYVEDYMRRRDPDCMRIGDDKPTDKPRFKDVYGYYFNTLKVDKMCIRDSAKSVQTGGCGECQTSCQSACKTSCGVANQMCEHKNDEK